MTTSDLTREELVRYARHIRIPDVGIEGQKRLRAGRVLLVGAGGLGSPAALYLAAAGVGHLGLVDHDRVELSNLQRQILHDTDSVGRAKIDSARTRLGGLNPGVRIETFETRLDASNALEILEGWDFIVDGSDNFPTRYAVNDACVRLGIPFAYGAIHRFEGQASVFAAPGGPCYRCLFRDPPPPGLIGDCSQAGVLGVLPGIVGSIQATEAIKWLLGIGDGLDGRLLLIDALRMEFRSLSIPPDPDCVACGTRAGAIDPVEEDHLCGAGERGEPGPASHGEDRVEAIEITVGELKRRLDEEEDIQLIDVREPFEWEICNLAEAGARLVPLASLADATDGFDRDRPLIIYCRTGPRGDRAVSYLQSIGFEDAVNVVGGIRAWAQEIDPDMPVY